ncbi:MAG: Rne/Rng family ribonuclease [Thermodesulfobacteriota bacterium]|nr:Rne/Rng family ribonuclease [Thermodesulfobacteriota bacterium]
MSADLVINLTSQETRVALIENGVVVEFYIERHTDRGIAGNIYMGRVIKVLPGMQAAFVDIGLDKAAFLYVSDVYEDFGDFEKFIKLKDFDNEEENGFEGTPLQNFSTPLQIEDILHEGKEILVQVIKEPMGSKGARISSHISLPGRLLVLMPMFDHIGISRRIENEPERKRLKEIIQRIKEPGIGFIVRTAGEGKSEEELKLDMDFLLKLWNDIQKKKGHTPIPSLIHKDLNIVLRAIRDLYSDDVKRVVVDSEQEYNMILEFIKSYVPHLKHSVELFDQEGGIFDYFGIEMEISRALGKRIWLKSGGYIVIEETEALTAIDVNTGRYVGKGNPEDTILKTNLEAVKEIPFQLRLRNIGGIIIIDFIDMGKESSRNKVFHALKEALKHDKAKTNILKISELGLIEMTRKRTRKSLTWKLCEPCSYCEGKGYIKSGSTICYELYRDIIKEAPSIPGNKIYVVLHPEIADFLYEEERAGIEELEQLFKKRIIIKANPNIHQEQYEISGR